MAASLSRADLGVLRGLARDVADIAALPAQSDAIARWKALNGLRPVRPLVLIDEIPWHEMDVDGELALRTEDETARVFERALRETLYPARRRLPVDMVVEAAIDVPKVVRSSGFGIERDESTLALDQHSEIVSHEFHDQLADEQSVDRIRAPEVELDVDATAVIEARAEMAFDGILEVRMQGWSPSFELWMTSSTGEARRRSCSILRPALVHVFHRLALHPTRAWRCSTSSRPGACWAVNSSSSTAPARGPMSCRPQVTRWSGPGHRQLDPRHGVRWCSRRPRPCSRSSRYPYASRWYERFGLAYYGCCEPLHDRDPSRASPAQRAQDLHEPVGRCGGRRRGGWTRLRIQLEAESQRLRRGRLGLTPSSARSATWWTYAPRPAVPWR